MHTHTRTRARTRTYTRAHTRTHAHAHKNTYVITHAYAHTHTCTRTHKRTRTHIHTHARLQRHTHTHRDARTNAGEEFAYRSAAQLVVHTDPAALSTAFSYRKKRRMRRAWERAIAFCKEWENREKEKPFFIEQKSEGTLVLRLLRHQYRSETVLAVLVRFRDLDTLWEWHKQTDRSIVDDHKEGLDDYITRRTLFWTLVFKIDKNGIQQW
jgi:hypothetical protein